MLEQIFNELVKVSQCITVAKLVFTLAGLVKRYLKR